MCAYVNFMNINLIGGRKDLLSTDYRHFFHSIDLTSHRDLLNLAALIESDGRSHGSYLLSYICLDSISYPPNALSQ